MTDVKSILAERASTHGAFTDNSAVSQEIKRIIHKAVHHKNVSVEQRESLDMIAHKIGRICAGDPDHVDHWDDIAGYATLVADILRRGGEA